MIHGIMRHSNRLTDSSAQLSAITKHGAQGVLRKQNETQQVATAMSRPRCRRWPGTPRTPRTPRKRHWSADTQAQAGHRVVNETVDTINALAEEVGRAADVIQRLKGDSLLRRKSTR